MTEVPRSKSVEHGAQKSVDLRHLVWAQPSHPFADRLVDIDGAELVEHEPGLLATHGHLGSKDVWVGAGRGRGDDDGRQVEVVGLEDHRVAPALLLVSGGVAGSSQTIDVTTH
jgi:hypothetical protein